NYVQAIARRHKVWLITRSNEKEETEQFLREHPGLMPNLTIHYIPWTESDFKYPLNEIPHYFLYRHWQWRAYLLGRSLDAQIDFDLVHHVNATGFREPGYLWKIDKPFVWGPVGGLQYFPVQLLNALPFAAWPYFLAKNFFNFWAMRTSRRPRVAAARAAAIIAGTSLAAERIQALWGRTSYRLCEVSAPERSSAPPARRLPGEPFRIVWSGRFVPGKAFNIVLLALECFNRHTTNWELICVGDGKLMGRWKRLAATLGIADHCKFLGRVPREEAVAALAGGHCFVQPSLYDATSSVVVEALAMGLPVVCLNHFGFKDAVSESCGIRIEPCNLRQVVRDFASAFGVLEQDEEARYRKALAAQKASLEYTWMYKSQALHAIYETIVHCAAT